MSESQTRTEQRASAVKPQETPAVVGEPGITERESLSNPPWEGNHPVNLRLTLPFFKMRCYVTLVAGTEKRSPKRLVEERRKHPIATTGNIMILAIFGIITGLAFLTAFQMASAYMLQQTGILVGAQ
jgi:hypothetical protein